MIGGPPDEGIADAFRRYRETRDPRLRAELVEAHWWIVAYVVRRYYGKGEPVEDLRQVAALGLVAAVERFDPEAGSTFPAFAIPTALGEVRRHFRDATWRVRVPRRVKDLTVQVTAATEELTADLGRAPSAEELADRLGVGESDVQDAWRAAVAARPLSTDAAGPDDERTSVLDLRTGASTPDEGGDVDDRVLVRGLLDVLSPRSRRVVVLRYFHGLSQSEVAAEVGISQPHVSRLLRAALLELRQHLAEPRADAAPRGGA